jgi:hypothetical protein
VSAGTLRKAVVTSAAATIQRSKDIARGERGERGAEKKTR